MAFKMSPIGKKKCPYSPMQKKGLINPSPVKIETRLSKAEKKAKDAGFDTFDQYFKDRYGEESAEKISQGPYPEGRGVVSSGGKTAVIGGRAGTTTDFISGMASYNKTDYINDKGEMIMKFTPKSNLKGGKPKYYAQTQGGEGTTKEITRDQYRNMLSKGTKGGKFRRPEEKDIGTGGASLAELDLL